jgi:hydrogenase maturation protease
MTRRVIGLGSLGGGDDGVGFAVSRRLREVGVPTDVDVLDCRAPDRLSWLLEGVDAAVLVDAAVARAEPGSLLQTTPEEIASGDVAPLSSHGLGIGQALALGRSVSPHGFCEKVHLLAVVIDPRNVQGDELSPAVAEAVPRAVARILQLLEM